MMFRSLGFCLFLSVGLVCSGVGFAHAQRVADVSSQQSVETIDGAALKSLIDSKMPFFLLDVRQQEEYDAGHIDGAVLIPLSQLASRLSEIPRDKKVVAYCRSGKRSARAAAYLAAMGYENVQSLSGGFRAWTAFQASPSKSVPAK